MGDRIPTITLRKKAVKRLRAGHPWAFRGDVMAAPPELAPGDVVDAVDVSGHLAGRGFYNPASLITFRMVSREAEALDEAFWRRRLETALALRDLVVPPGDTACRLVHAEADGLPGLVVDRYEDILVVQSLTAGVERRVSTWLPLLVELTSARAVLARNDPKARDLEGLPRRKHPLHGEVPAEVVVTENGYRFVVDLEGGQKTGAFLDQRENRAAAARYARGRVLDAFCYQGWFGIQCASQADEVVAVDGSQPALDMVARNADLNGTDNVRTVRDNVFDYLYRLDKEGERFDLVLLDPPAFAKSKQSVETAVKGYKEINLRAMRLLPAGGILVTSSCSFHLSETRFLEVLENAARDGRRVIQVLEKRTQARDHPILLTHPESYYLKCFVVRVL